MLLLFIVENSCVSDEFDKNHLGVHVIYCVVHGRTSIVCTVVLVSITFDETHHYSTLSDGRHSSVLFTRTSQNVTYRIHCRVSSASLNLDLAVMVCANCFYFLFLLPILDFGETFTFTHGHFVCECFFFFFLFFI